MDQRQKRCRERSRSALTASGRRPRGLQSQHTPTHPRHTYTHARAHARAHTRTHARTHTRTHTHARTHALRKHAAPSRPRGVGRAGYSSSTHPHILVPHTRARARAHTHTHTHAHTRAPRARARRRTHTHARTHARTHTAHSSNPLSHHRATLPSHPLQWFSTFVHLAPSNASRVFSRVFSRGEQVVRRCANLSLSARHESWSRPSAWWASARCPYNSHPSRAAAPKMRIWPGSACAFGKWPLVFNGPAHVHHTL